MTDFSWIDPKALKMLHEESLSIFGGGRGIRDERLFKSAMARPQNLALYEANIDICDIAASYAYGLANNHPFVDGNKRAAFLSIGLFLSLNGFRLTAEPAQAIQAVLSLAAGDMTEKELAGWIRKNHTPK